MMQDKFDSLQPIFAAIITGICYVMFPDPTYKTAFFVVAGTIMLDTYTKMRAIASQNGGYANARRTKKLVSRIWWEGLYTKLKTLLYISILAGLSYRVAPLAQVGVFLATFVYAMMFLREAQSVLENLDDSGHDVGWFLAFVKRKQDGLMEQQMEQATDTPTGITDGGGEREH